MVYNSVSFTDEILWESRHDFIQKREVEGMNENKDPATFDVPLSGHQRLRPLACFMV